MKVHLAIILLAPFFLSRSLQGQTDSTGPESYDQLVLTANSQLKQGQVDAASQTVQQAIRQNPEGNLAYAIAAKIASQQGNAAAVSDDLQKALMYAPDDTAKAKVHQLATLLENNTAPLKVSSVKTTPEMPTPNPETDGMPVKSAPQEIPSPLRVINQKVTMPWGIVTFIESKVPAPRLTTPIISCGVNTPYRLLNVSGYFTRVVFDFLLWQLGLRDFDFYLEVIRLEYLCDRHEF